MKRTSLTLALATLSLLAGTLHAEDAAAKLPDMKDPKVMAEMMQKMVAAGTPAEGHKKLESFAGNWNVEVKSWMAPDQPPTVTKGTAKISWILNGRFLQEEFSGEFMGRPFEGLSLTGYDNSKKVYTNVWLDELHTSTFLGEGTISEDGKAITFGGHFDCPITGEKDLTMRQVLILESPDKRILEMYDPRGGKERKSMEITYTRQ